MEKKTVDKSISVEPKLDDESVRCPTCGAEVGYIDTIGWECPDECPECGQRLNADYVKNLWEI